MKLDDLDDLDGLNITTTTQKETSESQAHGN